MDLATVLTAVASSVGLSLPAAAWLSRSLIGHRLEKDLARFKAELDAQREGEQARLEAEIRQRVETELGERAAMRSYQFEARRRLYSAIGPLRFQLLLACRDLSGRVRSRGLRGERYSMSVSGYYGRSSLYRILRPLCLGQMIEDQIAFADFSVDTGAVDLLRFKKAALTALSGDLLVSGHPRVDWSTQVEHVYADNLTRCASTLRVATGTERRAMGFHEFAALLGDETRRPLVAPFPALLEDFSPSRKPLLWLRLVGYGTLCNAFVSEQGHAVGFERRVYPTRELLAVSADADITGRLDEYVARCGALSAIRL